MRKNYTRSSICKTVFYVAYNMLEKLRFKLIPVLAKPIKNPFRDGHVIRNDIKMSRDVAAAYCESLGGALPIPQSQDENDWLRDLGSTHLGFLVGDGQELRKVWNLINYQNKY